MIPHILSIQSHVASGYVGNRAAVFPLQRLGCEVSFVNTVQFSNHTGYGQWSGDIFPPEHIQNVIEGLWQHGTMQQINALLSGYQGSSALGEVIVETVKALKTKRPEILYCCDPVIGDVGRGVYVRPDAASFIKSHAIHVADILTPNQFELGYLTDQAISTLADVKKACALLHQQGIKVILVTSLTRDTVDANSIEMLVSFNGQAWATTTPRFHFDKAPTGSGDATAAIFLAEYLKTQDPVKALELTTSAIYAIFKETYIRQSYELQLIAAQHAFVDPQEKFTAQLI